VDKRRVRRAFSRSAPAYDARGSVQRRVRERVLAMVGEVAPRAGRVLDVGAGTGALLARLGEDRPALRATAVDLAPGMCAVARATARSAAVAAADAEALPFRAGAFDLVVSTSALQWLPRLGPALAEVHRVLAPGGTFCLAIFGAETLRELRGAWREAAGPAAAGRTHAFHARADVEEALAAAGLRARAVLEEDLVEWHPDARTVLRALKEVGASSAVPGTRGLGGRAATLRMLERYDAAHAGPDGVPATYHVVYALAGRAAPGER
jgi:malonyl-CoA O-methyltransferase